MTAVFLDTVGILALFDEDDQWHELASVAFARLSDKRVRMVTSEAILWECGNAAARRPYRDDVADLRKSLLARSDLVQPLAADIGTAWEDYRGKTYGTAGIVDYLSFVMMRRLGISSVLTNDKHFAAAGFQILF